MKPGVLLLLIWTAIVGLPLILVPDFYFSPHAAVFLFFMLTLALVGAALGKTRAHAIQRRSRYSLTRNSMAWIVTGSVSGLLSCLIILYSEGFGIADFLSLDRYLAMAHGMAIERYIFGYVPPITARVLMAPAHCAAMIAATRVAAGVNKSRSQTILGFFPFLPALLMAVILTTRASFLFMAVLYTSAYLAARIYFQPDRISVVASRELIQKCVTGVLIVCVLFFVLQVARSGAIDSGNFGETLRHLRKWPFGSVSAFAIWFDSINLHREQASFGYYTFTGLFSLLGIRERGEGIFTDYVDVGIGEFSNVYSVFRGLVLDFGVMGTGVVMTLLGFTGTIAFQYVRSGRVFAIGVLLAVYAFVLWSPIVSFYAYTAHIAAIALYSFYLKLETSPLRFKFART
jgi:oligosaccharide repeat unit polymerase